MKAFVDSDVIISSLISKTGASHLLLNQPNRKTEFFVSNHSKNELRLVIKRMGLSQKTLKEFLKKIKTTKLENQLKKVKKDYNEYVNDLDDAHIVAGASKSNSSFLITYKKMDFKREKIKRGLGINLMTPGQFLQYLRSIK